jgi:hypothetical protein
VDALSLLQNRAAQAIKWPMPCQFNMPRRFARLSKGILSNSTARPTAHCQPAGCYNNPLNQGFRHPRKRRPASAKAAPWRRFGRATGPRLLARP